LTADRCQVTANQFNGACQRCAGQIHGIDGANHLAGFGPVQRRQWYFQIRAAGTGLLVAEHPQRKAAALRQGIGNQCSESLAGNLHPALAADALQHGAGGIENHCHGIVGPQSRHGLQHREGAGLFSGGQHSERAPRQFTTFTGDIGELEFARLRRGHQAGLRLVGDNIGIGQHVALGIQGTNLVAAVAQATPGHREFAEGDHFIRCFKFNMGRDNLQRGAADNAVAGDIDHIHWPGLFPGGEHYGVVFMVADIGVT